jgi:hypothetical protein
MPFSLTPEFLSGEIVLKESRATRYQRKGSNGKLWLTDQRLIFKAGFGYQMAWPLYNVSQVTTGAYGLFGIKVLHLIFDNGREERFSVHEVESWPEAVLAAKASAPPLPGELEKLSQQEKNAQRVVLVIFGLVMAAILLSMSLMFCLVLVLFVFIGLIS